MKAPNCFRLLCTLCLITCLFFTVDAQRKDVLMTNSQAFEVEAYKDIDGTPYYFAEWHKGKVYGVEAEAEIADEYLLNFNGYTKSFEVRKDNRFIALDEKFYSKVTVETAIDGKPQTLTFKTQAHPIYKNRFMKVVFEGTEFEVIQDYQVLLASREKQAYAGNQTTQTFSKNDRYYIVRNKKAKEIKLKKKSILGLFKDQEAALKKFVKDNGLKLSKEKELVQFLSYYEQLTHPKSMVAARDKE